MSPNVDYPTHRVIRSLEDDGFISIGRFEIAGAAFNYEIDYASAREWLFSVYAWVSILDEGTLLRIGKCEGPLTVRLSAYKRSLDDAMSGRLGPNEYFKGDTQPWEREGWIRYAGSPGAGLIFAKRVIPLRADEPAPDALANCEGRLIEKYDPLLCGVSPSGRRAKRAWVAQHGPAFAVSKRAQVSV